MAGPNRAMAWTAAVVLCIVTGTARSEVNMYNILSASQKYFGTLRTDPMFGLRYLPGGPTAHVYAECARDLQTYTDNLRASKDWAVRG